MVEPVVYFVFASVSTATTNDCREETTTIGPSWLEIKVIAEFRIWQILFLILAGIIAVIVFLCCFLKCRIPRTKQEIEADHTRKKLTRRFRCFLDRLTMDDMNLPLALDRVRELCEIEDLTQSTESKTNQSDESKANQSDDSKAGQSDQSKQRSPEKEAKCSEQQQTTIAEEQDVIRKKTENVTRLPKDGGNKKT